MPPARVAFVATLHVHADEAGNFNFTSGTRYFLFAVAWTWNPLPLADTFREKRFAWLKQGHDIPRFHCAADHPIRRDAIVDAMLADTDWSFCCLIIEKEKVFGPLRKPDRFYPKFLQMALRFVFKSRITPSTDRVLVFTDRLPNMQAKKQGVQKAIKLACAADLKPHGIPFHVFHHPSASNAWLQVVDYCCWAVQRKYEHGEDDYYRKLWPRMAAPELVLWDD